MLFVFENSYVRTVSVASFKHEKWIFWELGKSQILVEVLDYSQVFLVFSMLKCKSFLVFDVF